MIREKNKERTLRNTNTCRAGRSVSQHDKSKHQKKAKKSFKKEVINRFECYRERRTVSTRLQRQDVSNSKSSFYKVEQPEAQVPQLRW